MRESTDLRQERNLRNRVSMRFFRFQQGLIKETRFLSRFPGFFPRDCINSNTSYDNNLRNRVFMGLQISETGFL